MFGIRATSEVFDSTWAIFADRVMHPTLDPEDVALIKTQFLSGISQRREILTLSPNISPTASRSAGHPYGMPVVGTEASIARSMQKRCATITRASS